MKAYIFDKLKSSVNDVKCSNAVVSEFMNEVYDIIDITIFDFTVPWLFNFETPYATLPLSRHLTR